MKTVIEPFRTKMVEHIRFTTKAERREILSEAGYNLFKIKARDVIVDLLTDSGTSAMSSDQWAALMRADESYAGAESFFRLERTAQRIFGFSEIIPVHQGRAAERILFQCLVKPGDIIPSNNHFDTTRGNIENLGACALDLPVVQSKEFSSNYPFKGNIDTDAVRTLLAGDKRKAIPFGMITISNNSNGGQPVSLANIREYSRLLKQYKIPLYIDAARFAENAWLIKLREDERASRSINSIVKEIFSLADGLLFSAKKDGLTNTGGLLALNDQTLAVQLRELLILTEGFPTYGGLSGRDLETIAIGLQEVLFEDYLRYRQQSAEYLASELDARKIPIVKPAGIHAIYIDAKTMLEHIPPSQYPGQVLACELYLEAGIRACEIGSVMFAQIDPETGRELPAPAELVRLALPRRVYSKSHLDYVVEAVTNVFERRHQLSGLTISSQGTRLRHFSCCLQPVGAVHSSVRTNSASLISACKNLSNAWEIASEAQRIPQDKFLIQGAVDFEI